jgi:hypothetical protein
MIEFLAKYWEFILLGILIADKIVAATPCKWDDMILTAIKSALRGVFPNRNVPKP